MLLSLSGAGETVMAGQQELLGGARGGGGKVLGSVQHGGMRDVEIEESEKLTTACQDLGLSEGMELTEEELQLLLDNSTDDCDFLVPTILDGSSTGLEGASAGGLPRGAVLGDCIPRFGGCSLKTVSSSIWPAALERGVWPPDYVISDHGSLTASFQLNPPQPLKALDTTGLGVGGEAAGEKVEGWGEEDGEHFGLR
ncbi:unnamed protein product [Choristocarpus tenellus]